jgi:hypothetical protein
MTSGHTERLLIHSWTAVYTIYSNMQEHVKIKIKKKKRFFRQYGDFYIFLDNMKQPYMTDKNYDTFKNLTLLYLAQSCLC